MNLADIAVATITRVRGRDAERTVRQSLRTLLGTGIPVAASDGGSPNGFRDWLRRQPNLTLATRGDSLVRLILYTEPDKRDFFAGGLADFVERASIADSIGIQIAARSKSALMTFPPFPTVGRSERERLMPPDHWGRYRLLLRTISRQTRTGSPRVQRFG